ncbi:acyclic terpene utilization AtuA family protein [Tateyamaria sp. Alg231-49]|uniref:acyclic terpene utilization AtuA family protein n=1 Tax=Tateyamaria sp. Alg231-49 TaxID=1922219 RepID=UPI000D5580B6|nr:acyclic terpene utilization AtuA family protein [Tateyamaria sp. Alg231-49]
MVRVLIPSGALGLGYDHDALERGIANKPDLIAIDGGSTDSGPSYLGRGVSKYARSSTKLEWAGLMDAARRARCPLVIGTAGTCGAGRAVDWLVEITQEILAERGETAKIAVLKSDQPANRVVDALGANRITPLTPAPDIDAPMLESCTNIVALAGVEQITCALDTGADIVIAGRTTDTAIIAALPIAKGIDPGPAWHAAKIGECGALCATNPQSGVIQIDWEGAAFTLTPLADDARATPHTVSAHMLYENADPYLLHEPGGTLDVTEARYDALDDTRVRVTGSVWRKATGYNVKLEGARVAGYQTVVLAVVRDPHYVTNAATWAKDIIAKCTDKALQRTSATADDFTIEIRLIGQNSVLGDLETRVADPVEIGALGLVTAKTPELANEIGKLLNPYLLHHPLTREEEVPTFAFPFSPAEIDRGPVYEFCLNHVMWLDDPMDAFTLEVLDA